MVKLFGLALLACSLIGCIKPLKPDSAELLAPSTASRSVPDCAGCHAYPLGDVNHQFHLKSDNVRHSIHGEGSVFPLERTSGVPVCMDCHFGSIASQPYDWFDTTWSPSGAKTAKDTMPGDVIVLISPVPGFLPLPWGWDGEKIRDERVQFMLDSTARIGQLVSWMTSKKHMNGQVDVEFSSSIIQDSADRANAYNAKDYSCSNIGCHGENRKKVYRWASVKMGLPSCPTELHSPEVDSSCRYQKNQEPR